jgi:hypothetical protein
MPEPTTPTVARNVHVRYKKRCSAALVTGTVEGRPTVAVFPAHDAPYPSMPFRDGLAYAIDDSGDDEAPVATWHWPTACPWLQ